MILTRKFYQQPTLEVAEQLIGKLLVHTQNKQQMVGKIVETEAYIGQNDTACHASKGLTPRTEIMFGEAGFAYIYLVYGMHFMFNIVTEDQHLPAAVLIRAIEPVTGIDYMQKHRKTTLKNLCNGPAKLCQALSIDKSLNKWDLTKGRQLWLEDSEKILKKEIGRSTRIGINYADKKDRDAKWRFYLQKSSYVSKKH